ncbi:acetyl-CoA synthetase [Sulfolobus acidocaldarius]|uniref:Acetyl-coenzyme A synthetase n=3 Tax=Sulfolobus acidocaldarius TaxID=2285 RepID=Q4J776_SULAC|nr:acetyl-CoA synthetase [Sulfolobus acidocaldarius]AAY81356.1 acetyl-coenzyme A synthetase [Sulfolobus acidocaldarius DSM 639]AGE74271.1 acetyl-coenzyme A synthetase [Sulfolobus acidocaldarius Ron12/I]ALU29846.1 AMP-dependent synthetase [Sulfolobus acidocaldarius]ALU32585.1 AMP-dependent synthetase [Sulfolobus acidocaldarius]WCM35858.1 AMP-binding protein [Sulfolobus acidocaldarius DSM 639]
MVEVIRDKKIVVEPNLTNYDEIYRNFNWDNARKTLNFVGKGNVSKLVMDLNADGKDKSGLIWISEKGDIKSYTFHDLEVKASSFGAVLKDSGVKPGDRVVVMSKRVPSLYFSLLAIGMIGAVIVPIYSTFGEEAIRYRVENSGSKVAIVHESLADKFRNISGIKILKTSEEGIVNEQNVHNTSYVERSINDPTLILYTSGTTGRPKGIWHSQDIMTFYYFSGKYHFDMHAQDKFWHTGDPAWVAGFAGVWTAWLNSIPIVSYEGKFDAESWYSNIERVKVTLMSTAPTAIRLLKKEGVELARKFDLSSIRFIHAGGEYVDPDIIRWSMEVFGVPIHDGYGQTETATYVIANYVSMPIKIGSMGKPLPGVKALVVDENGNPLPPNTKGILALDPDFPAMAKGIWNDEERWKNSFKNGYYLTGDMGYIDEDGYFWYLGRADDIIKVSGYRISPVEIESVIMTHPAVAESAVIGVEDPIRGFRIKAYIVLKKDYSPSDELKNEIINHVRVKLGAHVVPREVEIVKELPHTLSGKTMRRVLRAIESGSQLGDVSTLENPETVKKE